jgi:hypothetical protein
MFFAQQSGTMFKGKEKPPASEGGPLHKLRYK